MKKIHQHGGAHYIKYLAFVHAGPELVNHGLVDDIALLDIDCIDAGQVGQNGCARGECQAGRDCKDTGGAVSKGI